MFGIQETKNALEIKCETICENILVIHYNPSITMSTKAPLNHAFPPPRCLPKLATVISLLHILLDCHLHFCKYMHVSIPMCWVYYVRLCVKCAFCCTCPALLPLAFFPEQYVLEHFSCFKGRALFQVNLSKQPPLATSCCSSIFIFCQWHCQEPKLQVIKGFRKADYTNVTTSQRCCAGI